MPIGVFLYFWVICPFYGRSQLEKNAYGAGKPGLNLDHIRKLEIALPPISEQNEITLEVMEYISNLEHIQSSINNMFYRSSRLRQSILKQAFSGKLVPQDPNDEPASVLLQRIQAEKANTIKAKTAKRQRQKVNDEN